MAMESCEICGKKTKLETYSYRVVCEEGTINIDAKYCKNFVVVGHKSKARESKKYNARKKHTIKVFRKIV